MLVGPFGRISTARTGREVYLEELIFPGAIKKVVSVDTINVVLNDSKVTVFPAVDFRPRDFQIVATAPNQSLLIGIIGAVFRDAIQDIHIGIATYGIAVRDNWWILFRVNRCCDYLFIGAGSIDTPRLSNLSKVRDPVIVRVLSRLR